MTPQMTPELEDLFSILRFPSISTASEHAQDVRACGEWLKQKLTSIGLDANLHETPQHPVVIAKNKHQEGRKTLLIYGHYDVQPVDPLELWDSPPFEPNIHSERIWARGATDNKGQLMCYVLGVEQYLKKHGSLPLNLIILFEGEEEIGSPNLASFLEQHKDDLACDIIAVSDTGMVSRGTPTMGYGLRGIAALEFTVHGPSDDLHSGVYGGAVANPATAAAQIVASLHDAKGRVAIEGFYDDVKDLETWEREMWASIPGVSDNDILANTSSPATFGEEGFSSAERLWARPTAEVNGIAGGYQGEGSKTVLPAEALVKLSFRLVPDQDPQDIINKAITHIKKHTPTGVTVDITPGHYGKAYYSDPNSNFGKAGQRALEKAFGKPPVLIREGGSIPIIKDMQEILNADSLLLGLALPDCKIHAPNENFYIENFEAGISLSQHLIDEIAAC